MDDPDKKRMPSFRHQYTEKSVYTGSRDKDICFLLWVFIGLAGSVLFIGFVVWVVQAAKDAL